MLKHWVVFFLLTIGIFSTAFSTTQKVTYIDPLGSHWQRWIIIEKQEQQNILLVVEKPAADSDQRQVSQVIVARIIFGKGEKKKIQKIINHYLSKRDLRARPLSYYNDLRADPQEITPRPLWEPIKNAWTVDDENKYAQWYKTTVTERMTVGSGLEFDCADYGLLMRWIYAHDNRLPIINSLAGSGELFGHFSESKKWSHLPTHPEWNKDERFKAAMRYLFASTYTRSIFNDLYPIKINKEFITPGSIILTLRPDNTGHTQVVLDVGLQNYCDTVCITVLFGNEPARDYSYKTQADIRYHNLKSGGFMRWRWPVYQNQKWELMATAEMPGYSLEQYEHANMSFDEYYNYIIESLDFDLTPAQKAYSLAKSLFNDLQQRVINTALGAIHCHYQYCDPAGLVFDQHSTPSRDKRFREKRDQLLRLVATLSSREQVNLRRRFKDSLLMPSGRLPLASDYIFNTNGISDKMSSDPSVSYAQRWGIDGSDSYDSALIEFSVFSATWIYRASMVDTAMTLCFDRDLKPICDPDSLVIKNLSTLTLDTGLLVIYQRIENLYADLSYFYQLKLNSVARRFYFAVGCPENDEDYCTAEDYLFADNDFLFKMTADPTHIYQRRMGLQNLSL